MCIFKDDRMCPLLSPEETRGQHNFEERKEGAEYPQALADRLHREGLVHRDVHFVETMERRNETAMKKRLYLYSPDCTLEERMYMQGRYHSEPGPDKYLRPEGQAALTQNLKDVRKAHFMQNLRADPTMAGTERLLKYPEFGLWFSELLYDKNHDRRRLEKLIVAAARKPLLFQEFFLSVREEDMEYIAKFLFNGFLCKDMRRHDRSLIVAVCENLSDIHRPDFEQFVEWNERLRNLPSRTRKQRKQYRTERMALRSALRAWKSGGDSPEASARIDAMLGLAA